MPNPDYNTVVPPWYTAWLGIPVLKQKSRVFVRHIYCGSPSYYIYFHLIIIGGNTQFFLRFILLALIASVIPSSNIHAQFIQQGNKLVGTGAIGSARQGWSVALSTNGNTAIVSGPDDSSYTGAAWVYSRSGGVWTQQGGKLTGTGATGVALQGTSLSLSADGSTAIIGAYGDSSTVGAAWIFTRSGDVWTQQGTKLVGSGAVGSAWQGSSVALSYDGNTSIVGGAWDSSYRGAAWVFTRSGGVWTQQGNKLVGSGAVGSAWQGISVSLSGDGNTALVGGEYDSNNAGAAWVYTRTAGVWTQQGKKLVGTGIAGNIAEQGSSVSLSADGNTAIIGGFGDSGGIGAVWVFTRSGGVWTQQGNKLVGTGAQGAYGYQGYSVSVSADGNKAIVGGYYDNSREGATWVFRRSNGVWTQQGSKLVGTGAVSSIYGVYQGYSVSLSGDGTVAIVGGPNDNSNDGGAWVYIDTTITTVDEKPIIQYDYQLSENYPNPFNPATNIFYSIPKESYVSLIVYDLLGREVIGLVRGIKSRGEYSVSWNAANVPSGVYYYRLVASNFVETKKMVLMK